MRLVIVRGLPGSGKTTFAHTLTDSVFEADDYFMQDGIYQFDREHLREAHHDCQIRVCKAMQEKVPVIAVSNTAVKRWEMNVYYGFAVAFNYEVIEITMSGKLYNSIHNVPSEVIERMKGDFEL
jgi:tRNA uridine 5-carbamoylmethylation protein Kti12